ncbi:MAG: hypothetical protein V1811_00545, partial [Candidatus Micrarchaeota archaeon]
MNFMKVFSVLIVGVLLFGCTSQAPASETSSQPTQQAAVATNTVQAQATATVQASGGEFESLMQKAGSVAYLVDYTTTMTSEGKTTAFQTVEAMKGSKFKTETMMNGQKTATYVLGDQAYVCTFMGQTTCLGTAYETPVEKKFQAAPGDYSITPLPDKTIAGLTALCFGISAAGAEGSYQSCYSKEGVPLYLATSTGSFTKTATRAQIGSVADSVFELPVQPTTFQMPSIPAMP